MKKSFIFIICTLVVFSTASDAFAQNRTLTLQECLQMALEQSKGVQIKQEEVKKAENVKKEARTAYLPKLDARLAYLHLSDKLYLLPDDKFSQLGNILGDVNPLLAKFANPLLTNIGNTIREELSVDLRNNYVGALTLVQPVFMGGKIKASNRMAAIGVDIAKQQEELEKSETLFNVESAYWLVISLENKVKTAEEYQKLLLKLESDVKELEAEGMAVKSDILKVRVKLNEVNMNFTKAENGLNLSKMQLCQYIGLPLNTNIELVNEKPEITAIHTNINEVWGNRQEIKSLEKLVDLAGEKEKIALSGYLPEVGFLANYIYSNPNFFNGFKKEFGGSWNVGITMKIPITPWGAQNYKLKSAKNERRINEIRLGEAKEKIELQYNQANYKLTESDKKLFAANSNMEEADENLRYAKLAFEEGLVGVTEVIEAQTAWFRASSEKEDAEIEYRINKLYFKKVNGNL